MARLISCRFYQHHAQKRTLLFCLSMQDCAWNSGADAYELEVTREEDRLKISCDYKSGNSALNSKLSNTFFCI